MKTRNRILRILGVLVYAVGIVLGIVLYGGATWADFEASLFDPTSDAKASIGTLSCPVILTKAELGTVSASFSNPMERTITPTIRTHISEGMVTLMRESTTRLSLAPGETQELQWTLTPDDAAYEHFILVRVYMFPYYPFPSRTSTCGVLVLDLENLTGTQVLLLTLAASVGSMALGVGLWRAANRPLAGKALDAARAMVALAGVVLIGIVVSFQGWWLLGAILLVITILLIGAMTAYFVSL